MLIEAISRIVGPGICIQPGKTGDVEDEYAKILIKAKAAKKVKGQAGRPPKERATMAAPETAVNKQAEGRSA